MTRVLKFGLVVVPVILSVVAFIAGHPTHVVCDPALGGHAAQVQPGLVAVAWTAYGGDTIYAQPSVCGEAASPIGSEQFAYALKVFIHEAAHARGVRSESCAEMTADLGVYQVLRDFYDVPFFTDESRAIGAQVLTLTRRAAAMYQPEICWGGAYG